MKLRNNEIVSRIFGVTMVLIISSISANAINDCGCSSYIMDANNTYIIGYYDIGYSSVGGDCCNPAALNTIVDRYYFDQEGEPQYDSSIIETTNWAMHKCYDC